MINVQATIQEVIDKIREGRFRRGILVDYNLGDRDWIGSKELFDALKKNFPGRRFTLHKEASTEEGLLGFYEVVYYWLHVRRS